MKALQNPCHEIQKYFAKNNWGTLTGYRHHCIKVMITQHNKVCLHISFNVQQCLALLSSSLCRDTQNKPYLHDSYGLEFYEKTSLSFHCYVCCFVSQSEVTFPCGIIVVEIWNSTYVVLIIKYVFILKMGCFHGFDVITSHGKLDRGSKWKKIVTGSIYYRTAKLTW